jgi:hypothetical protein
MIRFFLYFLTEFIFFLSITPQNLKSDIDLNKNKSQFSLKISKYREKKLEKYLSV